MRRIVLDTNILYAGLYSQEGPSFQVLSLLNEKYDITVSVPLVLEYEEVLCRSIEELNISIEDIQKFLDYIIHVAEREKIFFLWRPFLKDPKDDMVLELAVASNGETIVTYNKKDFRRVETTFGIKIFNADEFLRDLGENR